MMFVLKGGKVQAATGPGFFKDDHDGISPVETFHGTKYLLKWPDYRRLGRSIDGRKPSLKWMTEVEPWLAERGIKLHYHDGRKAIMFDNKNDAMLFKLSWDISEF